MRTTNKQWELACETSWSGWKSSQILSRMQMCQQKFLMTQIRNFLRKCIQEAQYPYSLLKRPKLRSMQAYQDDKGSLQKAKWRSRTSGRKIWWLDNSKSESPQCWRRISKQSQICIRGTRLGNSMDSILSVQNENFSGDGQELTKVSPPVGDAESHWFRQFIGIWQILEKTYHGIIVHLHHIDSRRMVLRKERYGE